MARLCNSDDCWGSQTQWWCVLSTYLAKFLFDMRYFYLMIMIVNNFCLLLSMLVWCYFRVFWIFVIEIVIMVGNIVFMFGEIYDACSIVMDGYTFSFWHGLRSGSSHLRSSLICFGCLPVKLRFSNGRCVCIPCSYVDMSVFGKRKF